MITALIIALAVVGYAASLAGLLADMKKMRDGFRHNQYLTRGDVLFCSLIAVVMPVGWLIGLKNLIGIKVDWDAPAFRDHKGKP